MHYGARPMFVRWQLYRPKAQDPWLRKRNNDRARLKAILVKSVRVNGKPRLQHVAFLASIETGWNRQDTDWEITHEANLRGRFWHFARTTLDRLDNQITSDERARIEATLAARVQPPTAEEYRAIEESRRAFREAFGLAPLAAFRLGGAPAPP